jgi:hypothetical protein
MLKRRYPETLAELRRFLGRFDVQCNHRVNRYWKAAALIIICAPLVPAGHGLRRDWLHEARSAPPFDTLKRYERLPAFRWQVQALLIGLSRRGGLGNSVQYYAASPNLFCLNRTVGSFCTAYARRFLLAIALNTRIGCASHEGTKQLSKDISPSTPPHGAPHARPRRTRTPSP